MKVEIEQIDGKVTLTVYRLNEENEYEMVEQTQIRAGSVLHLETRTTTLTVAKTIDDMPELADFFALNGYPPHDDNRCHKEPGYFCAFEGAALANTIARLAEIICEFCGYEGLPDDMNSHAARWMVENAINRDSGTPDDLVKRYLIDRHGVEYDGGGIIDRYTNKPRKDSAKIVDTMPNFVEDLGPFKSLIEGLNL